MSKHINLRHKSALSYCKINLELQFSAASSDNIQSYKNKNKKN